MSVRKNICKKIVKGAKGENAHPVVINGTELMKHLPDNVRISDEWMNEVVIYVPRDWWNIESND